jgi:uncharacterized membrane protein (UPF0182 family)
VARVMQPYAERFEFRDSALSAALQATFVKRPPRLRNHIRYPELLLKLQADVYGLCHMMDPGALYNREDLWTVAIEVGLSEGGSKRHRRCSRTSC